MFANWQGNYLDVTHYFISPAKAEQIVIGELERHKIGYLGTDSRANRVYSIHGKSVTLTDGGGLGATTGLYLFACSSPDKVKKTQNGQRFSNSGKSYTLLTCDHHGILSESRIRKLHPIECERLQTLPDNYTDGISDRQRYKALGNGWTVDVIVHLLKCLIHNK